jgi:hypothetical protein
VLLCLFKVSFKEEDAGVAVSGEEGAVRRIVDSLREWGAVAAEGVAKSGREGARLVAMEET